MATSTPPLPLHERIPRKITFQRAADLTVLLLLLCLHLYRLSSLLGGGGGGGGGTINLIVFLCESWFTFIWLLTMNSKWNPVDIKTYPDRLSKKVQDLPAVDMFVTTADPKLEPPIVTANTVLSLLAVDYPVKKLTCYVSDDGGSAETFCALVEASEFAKRWVPFCKKYKVGVRAPFVYFSMEPEVPSGFLPSDFMNEWKEMKNEYEELSGRIENIKPNLRGDDDLVDFSKLERGNYPSIVKVIWDNNRGKDYDDQDGFPSLVYVAREKRPKRPHHYKAGAMNVLARVSGVMTNAPFMLNVDCDMFVNNPQVIMHGMCLLLGFDDEAMSGFVQFPQCFYGGLPDDPFGNQLVVLQHTLGTGMAGLQGPFYGGTGCFHRRKVIYGSTPDLEQYHIQEKLSPEKLARRFGNSGEMVESVRRIMTGEPENTTGGLSSHLETAERVASCTYENNTCWGKEIGWGYGSSTEDILTGIRIHSMGWRSVYCTPDPVAFLGSAPVGGPASMAQCKRWATGLLEVLVDNENSPVRAVLTKKLQFRQCWAYLSIIFWALRSIPELCYSLLPSYCLLSNSASFLPKVSDKEMIIPAAIFILYNLFTLVEYLQCGLTIRAWWNNQRMKRLFSSSSWLFGLIGVLLKLIGLSETVFEVTRKDQNMLSDDSAGADPGRFTFDTSPLFIPGTAVVLVNLAALAVGPLKMLRSSGSEYGPGLGEVVCCVWVVANMWPIVKGLFGRGCYGIPWPTVCKAAALGSLFLQLCIWGSAH